MALTDLISITTHGFFEADPEPAPVIDNSTLTMSDLISIYTVGWFEESNIPEDITVYVGGWFEPDPPVVEDSYETFSAMPNTFFQEETTDYDRESTLFSLLSTEAINLHGVPMVYYIASYDTNRDRLLGEDANRSFIRNFDVQAYYELPNEEEIWGFHGIEGIDNFHMTISMRHFEVASTYNNAGRVAYPSYTPKEKDYIKAKYNNYFYQIVTVKKQIGQFLKRGHLWDLVVRPMRDDHLSVSATIPEDDDVIDVNAINDIFDSSAQVESEKEIRLYQRPGTEQAPDPLFGNF